jgi:AcrR family transcriptional regulator
MPRKPKQERSKATYDAIVEAGFICIAERGTAGTTTRHIADAAGIGVGSLYEYFANKQEIFQTMNQRFIVEVAAMLRPLVAQLARMSISDAIKLMLRHFEAFLNKNDQRYLKCAREALHVELSDSLRPVKQVLSEIAMQHVLHHPEVMRIRRIPVMLYVFINGGIFAVVQHLSNPNPPITFDELSEGLAAMISHYVERELQLAAGGEG